ncbi:MAG: TIGR03936 family radical SAM-associated protein [Coriobacteriales bacterium]|nr:TIGR03936 family radical SAM-associated protein [Coriobacteriales bacterium]
MAEVRFRLRVRYRKQGRLRFLSHLEVVRAMERMVRRAQLPYAVSQGFNAHMRYAPGPALPVGTGGLEECFDVWLTAFLPCDEALARLQEAGVGDLDVVGVSYVDPRAKGLQATHVHEGYEVLLASKALTCAGLDEALHALRARGEMSVVRGGKEKRYDLTQAFDRPPEVREGTAPGLIELRLALRSVEQGSLRPAALLGAAIGSGIDWTLESVTRVRLSEDEVEG